MGPYVMSESIWKYGNAGPYNISNASADLFFSPKDIYMYMFYNIHFYDGSCVAE